MKMLHTENYDGTPVIERERALMLSTQEERPQYGQPERMALTLKLVTFIAIGQSSYADIRNPEGSQYNRKVTNYPAAPEWMLDALTATAYSDRDTPGVVNSSDRPTWGASYQFHNVYNVDLERAENMVKILKHLGKTLRKLEDDEGPVESFGQFANRLARALGCRSILVRPIRPSKRQPGRGYGYDNDPDGWLRWGLGDAARIINSRIYDYQHPQPEPVQYQDVTPALPAPSYS